MPAREVERRMMAAARRLVELNGMSVSLDSLTLEDLIREADVPPASALRRWPSMSDFVADFLVLLVRPDQGAMDQRVTAFVDEFVTPHQHLLGTAAGRSEVFRETMRITIERTFLGLSNPNHWNREVAFLAAISGSRNSSVAAAVLAELRVAHPFATSEAFYDRMISVFGKRFRAGCTAGHLASAIAAITDGLYQVSLVDDRAVSQRIPSVGLNGERVEWHLAALAVAGAVQELVEDIPDWSPQSEDQDLQ